MSTEEEGRPPSDLMQLWLGFLKKGPSWTPEVTSQIEANQREHLALLSRLSESGELLLAGPTPESGDLRGILVINADSKEEVRQLFSSDAHIANDRLVLELHPLFLSRANLTQPLLVR